MAIQLANKQLTDGNRGHTITNNRPVGQPPMQPVIEIHAPPRLPEFAPVSASMGMILLPAASGVGSVLLAVTHQDRPLLAAAGLVVLTASIAVGLVMVIGSRTGVRRRIRAQRERYFDYLEQVRALLLQSADDQRARAATAHPDPAALASIAWIPARRWRKSHRDPDFLTVRIGIGVVPPESPVTLRADWQDPLMAYDPVCLAVGHDLAKHYSVLDGQPICLPLAQLPVVSLRGPAERVRELGTALLAQLVWSHDPSDVAIVVCAADHQAWDWVKWLPHCRSRVRSDGPLPLRLITDNLVELCELVRAEVGRKGPNSQQWSRRVVVLVDMPADLQPIADSTVAILKALGAHQIHLSRGKTAEPDLTDAEVLLGDPEPGTVQPVDRVQGAQADARGHPGFIADAFSPPAALLLAKSFASLRPTAESAAKVIALADPLGDDDVGMINPAVSWRPRSDADLLRVVVGDAVGIPVVIDLKESARGGMGPHGLVVGATGSGKSELLRKLVSALVISHPPESLALLLADFKGGATFSGFVGLPHVAGMITNLEADLSLVDRFRDALYGELQRRQELLAAAGKLSSLDAYNHLRRCQTDLQPVPRLLVIVDEFSEMLSVRPDLAELFVTIGRVGRSIGVHLLLATQRLETGRIRGLESHLSYRICLRTFSESESREALGRPDAYHLPAEPGWAYLRSDGPELHKFRSAMVSHPYRPPRGARLPAPLVVPFTASNGIAARVDELRGEITRRVPLDRSVDTRHNHQRSVLDVAIAALITGSRELPQVRPVRRIWLEPLPTELQLCELPAAPSSSGDDNPCAVIGLVDLPECQRQDPLEWNFSTGNGNLLIVGSGRSGKSTAAMSLLASLAFRYPPNDLYVVCVDFGGDGLLPFAHLPHVAAVGSRGDPHLTGRIFIMLAEMLAEREALFRRYQFKSNSDLREARAGGTVSRSVPADVVVIIDGWTGVQQANPAADGVLDEILSRGPGLGVHTIMTIGAANQLRTRLAAGFGGRIELRLSDSFDSQIDRRLAKSLPPELPGRALVAGRHYAQLALPVLEENRPAGRAGPDSPTGVTSGTGSVERLISLIRGRWPGESVPRLRILPSLVCLADIRDPESAARRGSRLTLGIADGDLEQVHVDLLGSDPHLLIYGDPGSGKTTVLRNIIEQLSTLPPSAGSGMAEIEIVVVDYRRGVLVRQPAGGRSWRAGSAAEVTAACVALVTELSDRLAASVQTFAGSAPDPDGTAPASAPPGQTPAASVSALAPAASNSGEPLSTGPGSVNQRSEIFVLVDDYDLVCSAAGNPLNPLIPFLPYGRDIGFHLLLTRRAGGIARAQYENLLQCLGDLGTPVILFSGSPTEGRLTHGLVPQQLPVGRAQLGRRTGKIRMIQTAWTP